MSSPLDVQVLTRLAEGISHPTPTSAAALRFLARLREDPPDGNTRIEGEPTD